MKIGVRKPNIKNRVKSRTTRRATRVAKGAVNPLYGKKGMGYVNDPERAVKNKVYKQTTVSAEDAVEMVATKGKSKKKGCLIAIISVLALFGGCSLLFGGDSNDDTAANRSISEATTAVAEATTEPAPIEATTEMAAEPTIDSKAAKDKVLEIKANAKKNAKNASKEDLNDAAKFINTNLGTCFDDKTMMELVLKYAYLLYFHYGKDYTAGDLGYNAVKAIRPVYEDGADPSSAEIQACVQLASIDIDMIVNGTATYPPKATTQKTTETTEATEPEVTFVVNTSTGKFHKPGCSSIDGMLPENRQDSTKTYDELIDDGWEPCQKCQ